MSYLKSFSIVLLAVFIVAACNGETETEEMQEEQQTTAYKADRDTMSQSMTQDSSIVGVAMSNQNLSTFVKGVKSTESVEILSDSSKSFTVFVPTDSAFKALPQGKLDSLMMENNTDDLRNILAYHVVEGSAMTASQLKDGQMLRSMQGAELTVTKKDGNILINGIKVVKADVQASNGVIHIVNELLVPHENQ